MRSTEILILRWLSARPSSEAHGGTAARKEEVDLVQEGRAFPRCRRQSRERLVLELVEWLDFFTASEPSRSAGGRAAGDWHQSNGVRRFIHSSFRLLGSALSPLFLRLRRRTGDLG